MAGYSGTPLAKKLGIKPGMKAIAINAPAGFTGEIGVPDLKRVSSIPRSSRPYDFIHFFTTSEAVVERDLPRLRNMLERAGMIWVSWPKKAARKLAQIDTDLTEDVVRKHALAIGLVDVKVCAVDDVWSGLKLVMPVKDRR